MERSDMWCCLNLLKLATRSSFLKLLQLLSVTDYRSRKFLLELLYITLSSSQEAGARSLVLQEYSLKWLRSMGDMPISKCLLLKCEKYLNSHGHQSVKFQTKSHAW